jgi:NADH dehydrogenase [ubiquinone] 1 alpha subcomplex assembly factor 2
MEEQRMDIARQDRIKVLAAQADARWAAQQSYLLPPDQQSVPGADLERLAGVYVREPVRGEASNEEEESVREKGGSETPAVAEEMLKNEPNDSPWKKTPAMDEPQPWRPTTIKRRR